MDAWEAKLVGLVIPQQQHHHHRSPQGASTRPSARGHRTGRHCPDGPPEADDTGAAGQAGAMRLDKLAPCGWPRREDTLPLGAGVPSIKDGLPSSAGHSSIVFHHQTTSFPAPPRTVLGHAELQVANTFLALDWSYRTVELPRKPTGSEQRQRPHVSEIRVFCHRGDEGGLAWKARVVRLVH